ncbi:MAG: aminotransferase class V-fold PLP-dependent enzyme [Pseudomonadota bacterium]
MKDDLSAIAARFERPAGPYLASHSVGLPPRSVRDHLNKDYLDVWMASGDGAWPSWLDAVEKWRALLAQLLGAQAKEICPQTSVSSALFHCLTSLTMPGAPIGRVVMHETAFPSMGFVVTALKESGAELSLIPRDAPPGDLDAWASALDGASFALITHVHSNTGALSPVAAIADLARSRGVMSVLDCAQSVGVVPFTVQSLGVDAIVGSSVKWLCGGPGAGFLWMHPTRLTNAQPVFAGWFSHASPFAFDIRDLQFAEDALKFWGGTPSVAPFVAASAGLSTILDCGVDRVRAHNVALQATLLGTSLEEAAALSADMGGTLCLTFPQDTLPGLRAALDRESVFYDVRGQTVRLSPHIYNTDEDAHLVGALLADASVDDRRELLAW